MRTEFSLVAYHNRSSLRRSCLAAVASADNHRPSTLPRRLVLVQMGASSSRMPVMSASSCEANASAVVAGQVVTDDDWILLRKALRSSRFRLGYFHITNY